ncbi:MAG: 3-hydroxyacyl-CoA dehydrogenase NAD-binding domain-containing protein [Acidimicrobiia bacterium]|nr:3-hydroxyacyl-CoA dehydrogenase NAD-binding domain-containing protein [Acidimicrobiia bacterium]
MTELTQSVRLDLDGDGGSTIAVIAIDNPPVNALSHHVRQGIADGMNQAAANPDVAAIVLVCAGRTFIAGADITEFGGPPKGPNLLDAMATMEDCPKPVVAAIHGTALGGGLEVAMCAHFRVAVPSARFGLPEVKLGLLPGAGGTQRLPRVTGVAKALELMTSGDQIGAAEALECGLVDEVVDGELRAGAVAFARRVVAESRPLSRIRDRNEKLAVDPRVFADFRAGIARKTRGFLAPEYNIRCIEAAVANAPDFDAGFAVEQQLFKELMTGTQSKAQQYYFFAEREAAKVPDVPRDTEQIPIATAGVLGAGTMGGGIAMNFANAGIPVMLVERDEAALERGLGVIRKNYERTAARGGISSDDVETRMGLIRGSLDQGDFADCDIVVEAVFEDMELKKSVFAALDEICKPGAVLASNTSALDVNEIAAATSRPASVIGTHFFSPANVMKLLEVVRGSATSNEVIATTMSLAKQIGKIPVLVGVCHGFVGNRMLFMRRIEADKMLLEGATPAQIDRVIFDFGFPMGPYAMSDLAGLDIGWKAETSSSSTVREILCESGRRGQKNGRGYYTYDPETRASTPDPEVEQMIREFGQRQGVAQRDVTDQEILERCLFPMVNEGAKILDEGIAIRPSDIDVVWINGYGWPVYTGGPMFWADTIGLGEVASKIRDYGERLGGDHWAISPLLARLAEDGSSFGSWRR